MVAFDPVDGDGVVRYALGEAETFLHEDVSLHDVTDVAAIGDLEVIDRIGTVHGTLFQIGQVEVTGWTHNPVSDRLEPSASRRVECLLRTRVLLTPDGGWPEGLDLAFEDGTTYLYPLTDEWDEATAAFDELLEALRALPGCADLDWPPPEAGADAAVVDTAVGTQLKLQADPNAAHGEWHATLTHAGTTAEVSCNLAESDYFGETWTMTVTVRTADGTSRPAGTNPWSLTAALLPSFGTSR